MDGFTKIITFEDSTNKEKLIKMKKKDEDAEKKFDVQKTKNTIKFFNIHNFIV